MGEVSGEDLERLANRMALLVSDDGEADNAGRAVGQLARRLGLSGGDLKALQQLLRAKRAPTAAALVVDLGGRTIGGELEGRAPHELLQSCTNTSIPVRLGLWLASDGQAGTVRS